MSTIQTAASAWVAFALVMVVLNIYVPQPFGPSALGAIFEPYLLLTGLAAAVVGISAPRWTARALGLALLIVTLSRYAPAWTSFPSHAPPAALRVSTWNILAGDGAVARALEGISGANADLVGLQELEPHVAAALDSAATGFPFRAMRAESGVSDVGLLSRFPILEIHAPTGLPALRVLVHPPDREPLVVYVAHPPLARFVRAGDIPYGVDFSARDVSIAKIREHVDRDLLDGRSVLLMGDFNTTEREPAYAWLAAGLRDAHLDAGIGPGFTWRPSPLSAVPIGMLRIDYVLFTPDLVASSSVVRCSSQSDHCRVDVEISLATSDNNFGMTLGIAGAASLSRKATGRRSRRRLGPPAPTGVRIQ